LKTNLEITKFIILETQFQVNIQIAEFASQLNTQIFMLS